VQSIHLLPKVELHCHLLGVISPGILAELRRKGVPVLVEPDVLAENYPVTDLNSFRRWVDVLKPYQCPAPELMRPILAAHIDSLIAQHVVYTEIMLSPTMFPRENEQFFSAFHQWREWAFTLEKGRIQVEFVSVVPRTLAPELLERDTQTFLRLRRENLICGVALVGPENGESIERFRPAFCSWKDAGLGIEIHAGEHSGPESVRDAIEYGSPDRLGHALSAFSNPGLVEYIMSHGIHIEFCPTSNIRTGAAEKIEDHPIRQARDSGLSFSLNTDDPGAFGCSMESEYETAAEVFGFGTEDFDNVFRRSLEARFEPKLRYLPHSPKSAGS